MTTAPRALLAAAGALALLGAARLLRARIYDAVVVGMTADWYKEVLSWLPAHAKLLDVGIGTGQALVANAALVRGKHLTVEGVDYDLDYVSHCRSLVAQAALEDVVQVYHASIYDFRGGPYDAVYFSGSLMLMPDPVEALRHGASMLSANGRVYLTQTVQTRRSLLAEYGKPLLKFLTTIDFGQVTYEDKLLAAIHDAGLLVVTHIPISGASMSSTRSFRLLVLQRTTLAPIVG